MQIQTTVMAIVVITLLSGTAVFAQFLVRKTFKHEDLLEHSPILEPLLGVVGTLFSVLLGFLVAGAMERYHDARVNVDLEANSVGDVFRLAKGLEDADRKLIRNCCREYVDDVLDDEWKLMETHKSSDKAQEKYQELWDAALSIQPHDDRITNIHQTILTSMQSVGQNRRMRIVASQHGLGEMQWLVVMLGSAITVVFTLLFPMRKASFHLILTLLVTLSLGLNIWLLSAYSTPFAGELRIVPYMFQMLRETTFKGDDQAPRYLPAQ
ncbi:MAG: DUF4239 domain-containing protein [Candidatus Obscuribacterales bacterium]|nr:DUF4239 domain-containing protein [Candidatus Obscuribacterales bacterium]